MATTTSLMQFDFVQCGLRLSASSTVGVTTTDQTAVTAVEIFSFRGNNVPFSVLESDVGVGYYSLQRPIITGSGSNLRVGVSQAGVGTTNGSPTLTTVSFAYAVIAGMKVSGTGIPANTTVVSADPTGSGTVTMSANATASGTITATFAIPANKNMDVFAFDNGSGGVTVCFGNMWTSDTVRADPVSYVVKHPFRVNTNAITTGTYTIPVGKGTLLGTVRTTGTDGQTEDSVLKRFIVNEWNKVPRKLYTCPGYVDNNALTTYSHTAGNFTQANAGTGSRLAFLADGINPCQFEMTATLLPGAAGGMLAGIGIDSTVNAEAGALQNTSTFAVAVASSLKKESLAEGYHTADLLIAAQTSTGTVIADTARSGAAADIPLTYLSGTIWG